jgi:glycogen synthase
MNILYAASEARPYVASRGLAYVAGALPLALNKKGRLPRRHSAL